MPRYGLMINYALCSGCASCEIACKNEHDLPLGKWGIKVLEMGPWNWTSEEREAEGYHDFEHHHIAVPTSYCDLCADRVKDGGVPSCALHCLCQCIEYGTLEELTQRMDQLGGKTNLWVP